MHLPISEFYLHSHPVDFRKSINGLSILLSNLMPKKISLGTSCLFYNSNRNRLKLLYYESHGACLWQKRFSGRRFKLMIPEDDLFKFDLKKLNWLRSGLDLSVFEEDLSKELLFF